MLAAASKGTVAELSQSPESGVAESIIRMNIGAALCVPLMLGPTVAAYVYLDWRSGPGPRRPQPLRPNAAAFCLALGRMAGLALANLKRIDMEHRQALIDAELSAAATAQRWIMPQREGRFGPFNYVGESRPGQYVGGDFFDVIPLGESRLAVALGDVSGKGIPASVLMTAAQGFLHAALEQHGQPDRAVTDLNRFVHPRRPENKFITLWVGVFDAAAHTLRYVDAGHGYALLVKGDGGFAALDEGDGLPVGIMPDTEYRSATVALEPDSGALIVSDGIIEQPGAGSSPAARNQFEMEGVHRSLRDTAAGADAVAALFAAVVGHAGTAALADDATAVLIRW